MRLFHKISFPLGLLIFAIIQTSGYSQSAGLAQKIISEATRADFQGPNIRTKAGGHTISWMPVQVRRRGINPSGQILGILETSSRRRDPSAGVYVYIRREGRSWVVYEEAGGQIVTRSDRVKVSRTSGFRRQVRIQQLSFGTQVTVSVFGATITYRR